MYIKSQNEVHNFPYLTTSMVAEMLQKSEFLLYVLYSYYMKFYFRYACHIYVICFIYIYYKFVCILYVFKFVLHLYFHII